MTAAAAWAAGISSVLTACMLAASVAPALAGQPYETDDPEPVACHHIEVDLQYSRQGPEPATAGSVEIDYGPTQNVELSVAAQRGETELGSALRLVTETPTRPQIAFLPAVQLKSGGENDYLLPLWAQKSFGKFTAFGGGGISKHALSGGAALQYRASHWSEYGAEFFTDVPRSPGGQPAPRFNLGYTAQLDEGHAVLISAGRSFGAGARYTFYLGYQFVLAPSRPSSNCNS